MGRSRSRSPRRKRLSRSRSRSPRKEKDRSIRRHGRSRSRSREKRRDYDRDVGGRSKRHRRSSRSASPNFGRDVERDRGRDRDRSRERSRERSRDRSRHKSREWHRDKEKGSSEKKPSKGKPEVIEIKDDDLEGKTEDEIEMMKAMGFCGFDTSKGKKVTGNDLGAVHHVVQRKYRQYMNRKGGFNRPLDYVN